MTTTARLTTATTSRHTWVPAVGGLAGALLSAKAALILGSGNTVPAGPMAALYLVGIAVGVCAAVGLGLRRRSLVWRVALGLAAPLLFVAWVLGLGELLEPLVGAISDRQHIRDEAPIGLVGLVLLGASFVGYRRDLRIRSMAQPCAMSTNRE
jgi:hypothetical protein